MKRFIIISVVLKEPYSIGHDFPQRIELPQQVNVRTSRDNAAQPYFRAAANSSGSFKTRPLLCSECLGARQRAPQYSDVFCTISMVMLL
jgi:hypothetical protein